MTSIFAALLAAALYVQAAAAPVPVHVPGTSDIWLAGMPAGSTARGGDIAPTHSPVEVLALDVSGGGVLRFTDAVGGVVHVNGGGCPPTCAPIDGGNFFNHSGGSENGIADARIPINALVAVFLSDEQPDSSEAPAALNFQTIGLNFRNLAPLLKQVFFIGDGLTASGEEQHFSVPAGATRLFLGTMDGFGWFNNHGAIDVNLSFVDPVVGVSEPAPLVLLAVSGLVGVFRRRRGGSRAAA